MNLPDLESMQFTVSQFRHKKDNDVRQKCVTWSDLCQWLQYRVYRTDKDGRLFSPARYAADGDKRADKNVLDIGLLVIDSDDGTGHGPLVERLRKSEIAAVFYSSHSHKGEWPKWRCVIPLAEPVPHAEWKSGVWKALITEFNPRADTSCCDASRMYYLPSCPKEQQGEAFTLSIPGVPLDWRTLINESGPRTEQVTQPTQRLGRAATGRQSSGNHPDGLTITADEWRQFGDVIEAYNERADHHTILTSAGWQYVETSGGEEHWRRPGKQRDSSATFNYGNAKRFVCWTISAPPLEFAKYTKFDLTCVLDYRGNVADCATALASQGYGDLEETEDGYTTEATEVLVDIDPEEDSAAPDPLVGYIRASDKRLRSLRKTGVRRNKYTEKEFQNAEAFLPAECVDPAVLEIIVGRKLRNREDAKTRDGVAGLGKWYAELPNQHGAKPYIVARTFGYPEPPQEGRPHPVLLKKMKDLQSLARIWNAFGESADGITAPPRLFEELVSLKDPYRREYYLQQWTSGNGAGIYGQIRAEKMQIEEEKAAKNSATYKDTHDSSARLFDEFTGEVRDTEQNVKEEQVARLVSPLMAIWLDALEKMAVEQGVTPEALLARLLCPENATQQAPKHHTCDVLAENAASAPVHRLPAEAAPAEEQEGGDRQCSVSDLTHVATIIPSVAERFDIDKGAIQASRACSRPPPSVQSEPRRILCPTCRERPAAPYFTQCDECGPANNPTHAYDLQQRRSEAAQHAADTADRPTRATTGQGGRT